MHNSLQTHLINFRYRPLPMGVRRLTNRKLMGIELRDAVSVLTTLLAIFLLGYNYITSNTNCDCNDKIKGFDKEF